jgi:hypothetical protein
MKITEKEFRKRLKESVDPKSLAIALRKWAGAGKEEQIAVLASMVDWLAPKTTGDVTGSEFRKQFGTLQQAPEMSLKDLIDKGGAKAPGEPHEPEDVAGLVGKQTAPPEPEDDVMGMFGDKGPSAPPKKGGMPSLSKVAKAAGKAVGKAGKAVGKGVKRAFAKPKKSKAKKGKEVDWSKYKPPAGKSPTTKTQHGVVDHKFYE